MRATIYMRTDHNLPCARCCSSYVCSGAPPAHATANVDQVVEGLDVACKIAELIIAAHAEAPIATDYPPMTLAQNAHSHARRRQRSRTGRESSRGRPTQEKSCPQWAGRVTTSRRTVYIRPKNPASCLYSRLPLIAHNDRCARVL